MARQTLSANESQTIQTSNACKFRFLSLPGQRSTQEIMVVVWIETVCLLVILMSIPLSGFVFPPESDQQLAYEIGETISFPDDMVQTTDKGNELRALLGAY